MSASQLPERASLEFLKKLAKDQLHERRRTDPSAKLAAAQLAIAREYGFSSWRALKAELDAREKSAGAHGWTPLHTAAQAGDLAAVRQLLANGANVNAREEGDNTYPLHWAAAGGHVDVVRALLDAGGDVHGFGDVHEMDAIGWATSDPHGVQASHHAVVDLLLARGARHHIYSAISMGDLGLIRDLAAQNPHELNRRRSRFEGGRTPLHEAIERKRDDILGLLIELGANLEAMDMNGRTPMAVAMLVGDREAMTRLHAAGAATPPSPPAGAFTASMAKLAGSVGKLVPMIHAPDVVRTLEWYASLGFRELTRYADEGGDVNFGMVAFGKAEIMLNKYGDEHHEDVSLWFYTDRVDDLYQLLKTKQLEAARATLAGTESSKGIVFAADIEDTFYGARQFAIRDPNGYELVFIQGKDEPA